MHKLVARLDLNLLLVLDAVAHHRHVTEAAGALGLSQSATSHAIGRLREATGDPLFLRGAGGLVLTPRAEALARAVRGALVGVEQALQVTGAFDAATSAREFRVAAADAFDIVVLPELLDRLHAEAPQVNVSVVRPQIRDISEMLETGEVDLYYGVLPNTPLFSGLLPDPGARGLQTAKVGDESWIGVVRREHPRIRKAPALERYAREGHILYSPTGGGPGIVDRLLEGSGRSRRIALRVSSFHAALDSARRTDFIWTAPRHIAEKLDPDRQLRHFRVPLDLPDYAVRIVWHERYAADPAHRWFRERIIDVGTERRRTARGPGSRE